MRTKKEYAPMKITKELKLRLEKEKESFQKTIGGGTWSIEDAIWEIIKIANIKNK